MINVFSRTDLTFSCHLECLVRLCNKWHVTKDTTLIIPLICMGLYICCFYSMSLIFHVIHKVVYVTIVELAYVIIR